MSDGGLLQKAMEQQETDVAEIVADAVPASTLAAGDGGSGLKIGLGIGLVSVIGMWILSSPNLQSDYSLLLLIPLALGGASFWYIWNGMNRKHTEVLAAVLILLLSSPFLTMSLNSSTISITDSTLSSDSTTISLTLRESGGLFGSSSGNAEVSVTYDGDETWSGTVPFAIDREDGYGKYGEISLLIAHFYAGNTGEDESYVVKVVIGDSSPSFILASDHLQRSITRTQGEAIPAMGTGNDCGGGHDNCVIGAGLKAWIGLPTLPRPGDLNPAPAPLPYAEFLLTAVLSKGGVIAISYPIVTVMNGEASWDSESGTYGSGSADYGEFGSILPLDGSVDDFSLNMAYIPRDDWGVNDYGCYKFVVDVTQVSPWSDGSMISSLMYYELSEEGGDSSGNADTDEAWTEVDSC